MKVLKTLVLLLIITSFTFYCSPTRSFILEEPQEGKSLVLGAVLVENVGIEEVYEAKTANITVVLVGKHQENGEEKVVGYRVKTDQNGYFALPNVPAGSYVVKGLEVDLAYNTHMLIGSRWEGNTQIYQPVDYMIDYHVAFWPPESQEKIINLQIRYFHIDASSRIFDQVFKSLQNNRLNLKEMTHTMVNPLQYYQEKYPDWGWFK
jgi:hypothetical protein